MSEEIKINKHDYNRVVLTEVQPYELPFILTNEGFYSYLKEDKSREFFAELFKDRSLSLPFDFKITKNSHSFRKLSLIHPFGQTLFVDFYRKFNSLIKSKCCDSKFSLRHPVDIALYYLDSNEKEIDSKLKDEGVDVVPEKDENTPVYASSFFSYKKYNFLYKFYDSYEFHRIERKFSKLHKFDLSKCFENLSPGMLPSAHRGEEVVLSEKDSQKSFESEFSNLISSINLGRTHGIVIGPEFSRIYAEILLQKLDKKIELALAKKGIQFGRDYIIKRYVDDYFLFYDNENSMLKVKQQVMDTLSEAKLFINESKDEFFERPFITGVTKAKLAISEYFKELFDKVTICPSIEKMEISANFYNYSKLSNRNITKLKSLIKEHEVEYESVSGYFFTILKRKVTEINEVFNHFNLESKQVEALSRFLLSIVEILFFVYSMDRRVRATYLVSEVIIQISEISKHFSYESELMISDKILQEAKFSIKNAPEGSDSVESLNLALSLETLNTENSLSVEDVRKLIGVTRSSDYLNYFQLVVGLYFIKNKKKFYNLKIELFHKALAKIGNSRDPLQDSELTHMIFDLFSCPHLSPKVKESLLDALYSKGVIDEGLQKKYVLSHFTKRNWFVDWRKISIKRLLKKKQLRSAY